MRRSTVNLAAMLAVACVLVAILGAMPASALQPDSQGNGSTLAATTAESALVAGDDGTKAEDTSAEPDLTTYKGKARAAKFADLDPGAWYMNAPGGVFPDTDTLYLDYTVAEGLMSGYSATAFAPDDALSRGMAATIIYRMATGKTAETTDNSASTEFSDVPAGRWYSAAVAWCSENGVVTGYPGTGRFEPDGMVTRAELATMISRYCKQVEEMPSASYDLTWFYDLADIQTWSSMHVVFCAGMGIMNGFGGTRIFAPQAKATRCQMAKIVAVTALAVKAYRASQVWEEYVPKYSYELYFVDIYPGIWDGKTDMYTGINRVVYIKTDNPNPETIDLNCVEGTGIGHGFTAVSGSLFYQSKSGDYEDVAYTPRDDDSPYQYAMHRVEGGYVAEIHFENPGSHCIEVREHRIGREMYDENKKRINQIERRDYVVIGTTEPITVHDYDAEEKAWMDDMIGKAVAKYGGTNPKEKMGSVVRYLRSDFRWDYVAHREDGSTRHTLSRYRGLPYFVAHRCNSYTSPSFLCWFAEEIGGFEDVHNCYWDYVPGTKEWDRWHYYCRVTYQGVEYFYECCPSGGVVPTADVDFVGGSNLIRVL